MLFILSFQYKYFSGMGYPGNNSCGNYSWNFLVGVCFFLMITLFSSCQRYPKDPMDTLDQAMQRGSLRIGCVSNPPWVILDQNHDPDGLEVNLIKGFAKELGIETKWFWGRPQQHFESLETFELDLVIGGFTKDNPWKKRVAFTFPYYINQVAIGIPPGTEKISSLKGKKVAAVPGRGFAGLLKKKKATVVYTEEVKDLQIPLVAEDWEIEALGFKYADIPLKKKKHVLMVPPGENALLMALEDFLLRSTPEERMKALLSEYNPQ